MVDRSDEGGDPACWAHLFEDDDPAATEPSRPTSGAHGRLRDRVPVNRPYEGIVAEGYDAWISVDRRPG